VFKLRELVRPDGVTYKWLVGGYCDKGDLVEASKVWTLMGDERFEPDVDAVEKMMETFFKIKGLLRLRRASEVTQVFGEMVRRDCKPNMHTYIMLLLGHSGRRRRKGSDPLVNFDTIFVGGMVKTGKSKEASKYVERVINKGMEVPRFDYNKFLNCFSNEEQFEDVGKKVREVRLFDLVDILESYGQKMATRDRRRTRSP
ncbi:hypothetical protein LR48_Vigan07g248600, partial [Vigna angularis]